MISAIVCVDENWGIGCNNGLLVNIPEDMRFFKEKTMNNAVIMGRKTYDSLPKKPLPNRINYVITSRTTSKKCDYVNNCYFMSMDYIKDYLPSISFSYKDIFIIGGGMIYKELLPYCEKIYLTKVFHGYENVDTYFPNIDNIPEWEIESTSEIKEYDGIKYQFYTYSKKEVMA